MYRGTGAENLRANEKTPASSVPAQQGTGGSDMGGTENTRAGYRAPAPAKPAAASGGRSTQGPTFSDSKV